METKTYDPMISGQQGSLVSNLINQSQNVGRTGFGGASYGGSTALSGLYDVYGKEMGNVLGGVSQQQQAAQGELDHQRANILQAQNQPMALYGFMSDILGGSPSTMGYQYQQSYGQPGSPFSQMLGTGATLLGGLGTLGKL